MKPMMPKISLRNVSVGYMSETVIKGLSLDIQDGEITGICGPNGAGKTTLLCAVKGLARLVSGSVLIDGRELNRRTGDWIRKGIGYVPQHFDIDPMLPVISRDVMLMGSYGRLGVFRYPGREEDMLMQGIADMLEIGRIIERPFGQLSGGEKKRILIARALMQKPGIMLFDEIFSWLDSKSAEGFTRAIRDMHAVKNLTVLIVSHDMGILRELCSRIISMENGRISDDTVNDTVLPELKDGHGIS